MKNRKWKVVTAVIVSAGIIGTVTGLLLSKEKLQARFSPRLETISTLEDQEKNEEEILNLDQMVILPIGVNDFEELLTVVKKENLHNPNDNLLETLRVSDYMELMADILNTENNLETFGVIDEPVRVDPSFIETPDRQMLYLGGYLTCFKEEEIRNNVIVTHNHFTRVIKKMLNTHSPYMEVSEEEAKMFLGDYDELEMTECPPCRIEKLMHLLQNGILAENYNGDLLLDKPISQVEIYNYLLQTKDIIESGDNDCRPCQESEIYERRRGEM